ncbi:hypothetical protein I2485_07165 [Nesterenkonia sp. E16_7]|uniref:hypothetical protein n=1 Tax=unclassified Nesterenkonia TaxID=2629769 RepID=UPI001A939105|nr:MULTISPECIES: hypothetical protein [unclassified Nesterenkonia]MBO0594359.1 hypothetical protein [Nesterenkonia sp. E16_10]MBO0598431.1 hypothetical protein [Nesterenkonia sp. E16_7]
MLDARTVQLGAGAQAVRILGPAQQTLKRLGEARTGAAAASGTADAAAADAGTEDQVTRVRARRQLAAVLIDGLPRPGALLAEQLARLPLGLLLLRDDHPVDREDVAEGYPAAAVGHTRAVAVRRSCMRQNPEMTVLTCSEPPPQPPASPETAASGLPQEPVDIHVIFAVRAVDPTRLRAAAARARLVLPVVRAPEQWQIGPLLSRERGPCPQCLELYGTASDPHWTAAQAALAEQSPIDARSSLSEGDPGFAGHAAPAEEAAAAVVASLLAREIQLVIDGQFMPQTARRRIGLGAATGWLSLEPVTAHPECECRLRTPGPG